MTNKERIKKLITNPLACIIFKLGWRKCGFISDKAYLSILYKYYFNKKLDLDNPKTFNEKMQWLKLYNRVPEYSIMVDKLRVRSYIDEKIGADYLIPLLGTWDRAEEIDFDKLPSQFVLKCNHNSGTGMLICKDKAQIDIKQTRIDLEKGLQEDYYLLGREWPYKDVPRKIIAEQYMVDDSGKELKDYKVLCFDGVPKLIEVHAGRFTDNQTQDFYDCNWKKTTISQNCVSGYKVSDVDYPRPSVLDEMLGLSQKLAKDIPLLRVDWYVINGKLYFGELTFFDGAGFDGFDDPKDDLMMGTWITLPKEKRFV